MIIYFSASTPSERPFDRVHGWLLLAFVCGKVGHSFSKGLVGLHQRVIADLANRGVSLFVVVAKNGHNKVLLQLNARHKL